MTRVVGKHLHKCIHIPCYIYIASHLLAIGELIRVVRPSLALCPYRASHGRRIIYFSLTSLNTIVHIYVCFISTNARIKDGKWKKGFLLRFHSVNFSVEHPHFPRAVCERSLSFSNELVQCTCERSLSFTNELVYTMYIHIHICLVSYIPS